MTPRPPLGLFGGDGIHTAFSDSHPHLTGFIGGKRCRLPSFGRTTLPMSDAGLRLRGGRFRAENLPIGGSFGEPRFSK